MSDTHAQRRKGAAMIIDRCKELARDLGIDLEGVEWKENIEDERDVYTLVVHVGPNPDQIPLAHTEIETYAAKTGTKGTDAKLKSVIQKRPSGF